MDLRIPFFLTNFVSYASNLSNKKFPKDFYCRVLAAHVRDSLYSPLVIGEYNPLEESCPNIPYHWITFQDSLSLGMSLLKHSFDREHSIGTPRERYFLAIR